MSNNLLIFENLILSIFTNMVYGEQSKGLGQCRGRAAPSVLDMEQPLKPKEQILEVPSPVQPEGKAPLIAVVVMLEV